MLVFRIGGCQRIVSSCMAYIVASRDAFVLKCTFIKPHCAVLIARSKRAFSIQQNGISVPPFETFP